MTACHQGQDGLRVAGSSTASSGLGGGVCVTGTTVTTSPPEKQMIGLDFHEVKETLKGGGVAAFGEGEASGPGDKGGGTRPRGFDIRNAAVRKAHFAAVPVRSITPGTILPPLQIKNWQSGPLGFMARAASPQT